MDIAPEIAAQEKQLARLLDWVRAADAKAQIPTAANLALVGGMVAITPIAAKTEWLALVLVLAGLVFPGLSLYYCLRASQPNVVGPARSLIFFKRVRQLTFEEFRDAVRLRSESDYLEDLLNQCHVNAQIVDQKYGFIRTAWILMFWGIAPWLVVVFVLYRFW